MERIHKNWLAALLPLAARLFQKSLLSLICLLVSSLPLLSNTPEADFKKANALYDEGNFAQAATLYRSLASEGNPDVFYNLGNAHYRLGEPGLAALNYERTLLLNPNHREAQANLRLVRLKNAAIAPEPGQIAQWIESFRLDTVLLITTTSAWVLIFSALFLALNLQRKRPSPGWAALAAFSAVVLTCGIFHSAALLRGTYDAANAIITYGPGPAIARTEPTESAATAAALPPGSKVKLLSQRGSWAYMQLPNNERAWLLTETLSPIIPASPSS